MLHCAAPHHHVHGSIAGLDGSYEHDPKPDQTRPDQIREFRSVPRRCIQQHTNTHNKLFSLSHSSSVFINSMLCLPLFSDAWLGRLKLSLQQKLKKLFINKQTNKQTISHSNKVIATSVFQNPLGAFECVLA